TTYDVAIEKAQKRDITEFITANGKIKPETEVKISPDVSGEIVELYIKDGDKVKDGQLLLKIKPDTYISIRDRAAASVDAAKANLANSRAQLEQIKVQFEQARLSFNRNKKLWDEGVISEADWENAKSSFEIAEANVAAAEQTVIAARHSVKSAEASLTEANENLIKTSVYAPMSGTISILNVEKGERVVGTELMTGTEMLRIADLSKMEVLVEVNENDIVRVNELDTAIIELDAYLDRKFRGVVTEIANSAKVAGFSTDQVTSFEVKILLLEESYKDLIEQGHNVPFRPGMSASADIRTEVKFNVLSLPIQAVTTKIDTLEKSDTIAHDEKDKDPDEIVFIYENGKVQQTKVTTGIQDNNYIEILEGLVENDEVVVAPYNTINKKLKDGSLVNVVDEKELYKKKK
ncbi:MAG: efflux RND transporter periplasmic adaptor subunit, partial [Bacteroidales bacterium]